MCRFDLSGFNAFLGRRTVVSMRLIKQGLRNATFFVHLDDGLECILKHYPGNSGDSAAAAMIQAATVVNVPKELFRGEDWSVYARIAGREMPLDPNSCREAARNLASLATLRFPGTGWIEPDGSLSPFSFEGLRGFAELKLDEPEVQTWLDSNKCEAIRATLARENLRVSELDAEKALVHGDFNPTNILMRNGTLAGIVDWEFAHAGTPFMDIGNLLRHLPAGLHTAVREGLQEGGMALFPDWKERAELADLGSHLEFLGSNLPNVEKKKCVERVDRFIALFS